MSKLSSKPYTLYDPSKALSSAYVKRAAKELGEKSEQIPAHIESFRRWLKSMPHLKCNASDDLLLAFLRQAKYNHMKAQNRLDNFCTFRTSPTEGSPAWYENLKARRANYDKWIDTKCSTMLGFTQEGSVTLMIKCKNLDINKISINDIQAAVQIWYDEAILDHRIQIGGFSMIMDLTDVRKEDVIKMFDPKSSRLATKYFQECLPFRIKKVIYYNPPKIFETMFKIISEWLTDKIKSRVMMIGTDMNQAFDALPGLKDIMPECYGGNVKMTFEELCGTFLKKYLCM
ncbi:unnamed protein product [Hymenolepis diminuta]|uniref:CRAL-TRIO domain-containing protein n=1 Tax=Hymenolepis diminuta TaxID=6216 RepID=A0A564YH08_HYMDI|nr:unnamed protein product [Hymenolepis diminuta]